MANDRYFATRRVDYLAAGLEYRVEVLDDGNVAIHDTGRRNGRTTLKAWQFDAAVNSGALVEVECAL